MRDEWTEDEHLGGTLVPIGLARPDVEFADFYRAELAHMTALSSAIAGPARAEELAQEALLRAHRDWDRVRTYDKPGAWLRRVTTNLAISARRQGIRERLALVRVASRSATAVAPPDVDEFWALVRELPAQQGAAVALYYLHDLSIADVADALGCAEGTAKAHLHKARTSLAARLASGHSTTEGVDR